MASHVLVLLALHVGGALCFSWDIMVGQEKRLEFYKNGTLTYAETIPSVECVASITYDPIQYRVLLTDYHDSNSFIYSFDLLTKKTQLIVKRKAAHSARVVYDPVTQLLFWKEWASIFSFSLNPAVPNKAEDGNLLFELYNYCHDIAVDSCGGFIYWITDFQIERSRFDGSMREVLLYMPTSYRSSLTLDHQTQRLYWIEEVFRNGRHLTIESADLNLKNRRTLYEIELERHPDSLAVAKDFIYWRNYDANAIWRLPKNESLHQEARYIRIFYQASWKNQLIAANYTITEQTEGNENCGNLKSLVQSSTDTKPADVSALCVHGTEVDGESRCECTKGYTGDRCEVSICNNYCLQGDCSVSAEGQPECRCHAGYSGKRCEVNASRN